MHRDELAALYDDHGDALYAHFLSATRSEADACDLLQNLFVKVGRSLGSASEMQHPRSYLLRAATHLLVDAARRRAARRRREGEAAAEAATELLSPEDDPDREAFRVALEEALSELPPPQRAAVHLKLWGGLTFAEIAGALDVSANTAASRYRYGIDKLRQQLRPLYDEIR